MQMKTNKNGVKLLAATMALAMVLVAGFVVIGASDSDAVAMPGAFEGTIADSTGYKVVGEKTAAISEDTELTTGATFVLVPNAKLTVTIPSTSADSKKVIICAVSNAEDGTYNDSAKIEMTSVAQKAVSVTFENKDGKIYITTSNKVGATNDINLEITTIETHVSGTLVSTGAISGLKFGISVYDATATDKYTYYPAGKDLKTLAIEKDDIVKVVDGSVNVTQGDSIVKFIEATSTAGMTVTGGDSTYPALDGEKATGTVSVTSGYFIGSITKANYVLVNGDETDLVTNQIPVSDIPSAVGELSSYDVYGTVVQNNSIKTTVAVNVMSEKGIYTIPNGVTLQAGAITADDGTLRVLGTVITSSSSITNLTVGPSGIAYRLSDDVVNPIIPSATSNVSVGDDTIINGDVLALGDSIIGSAEDNIGMTIPEGKTVTLDGNLGLNGQALYVNGTLVINKGSSVYGIGTTDKIVLGPNGKIENNGTIGAVYGVNVCDSATDSIKIQGVSGAEFVYKSGELCLTGNITAVRNAAGTSKVLISGASITGDLTIGSKVTLNVGLSTSILKGSAVTINGVIDGTAVTLAEGAQITVNGTMSKTVGVKITVGDYNSDTNKFENGSLVTIQNDADDVTGFTAYSKRVSIPTSTGVEYKLRAYINGVIKDANVTSTNTKPVVTVTGTIYIAADETLFVNDDAELSATVIVDGLITVKDTDANGLLTYIGAYYEVTGTEADAKTVGYYTNIVDAMAAIDSADEKCVSIKVVDLDQSITVAAGQELNLDVTGTVGSDAVVTAEADSEGQFTIAKVKGMVIISGDSNVTGTPAAYASKKTATDGTVTYAGLAVAIANASAGDVIAIDRDTIGSDEDRESLSIPAGVTVQVSDKLTINGNLNVPETAKLVGGTIEVVGKSMDNKSTVNVAGTLDLSNGILTGSNFKVTSTGDIVTQTKIGDAVNGISMAGAYYQDSEGNYVLTSVSSAIAAAKAAGASSVNVVGPFTDTTAITLDGVNLVIDAGDDVVVLGDVTLASGASIDAQGDLTANVTAKCGSDDTTGAVSDAVVKLVKSSVKLESKKVTSAAGVSTYTFYINKIDGEMTVAQGTVTINTAIETTEPDSKLTIDDGAELVISKAVTIDGSTVTFIDNGTVTAKAQITFQITGTGKTPVINGILDVTKDGSVVANNLSILGTVNVEKTEDAEGSFDVQGTGVSIGAPIDSLGASAAIVGKVSFTNTYYIIAYAGADMTGAVMDDGIKSTAFYVNGVPYATVYNGGADLYTATPANAVITVAMLNAIDGLKDITTEYFLWKDASGKDVETTVKVGDKDALYYTMAVAEADIKISVGTGMSLWIDGIKQVTGETVPLTVGDHDVKVTINPGYKGTATITFNGQTVSNGKITVTSAMVGVTNVISATGEITIDSGDTPVTPVEPEKKDDGMGITDYLLIVLVVLAAILVVIVAIRMMRS